MMLKKQSFTSSSQALLSFNKKFSAITFVLVFIAGIIAGALVIYLVNNQEISNLNAQIQNQGNGNGVTQVYSNSRESVVLIQSITNTGTAQGSGFIYNYNGRFIVVTNYHVIEGTNRLSITLFNNRGYAASVIGSDPYSDLAVLSIEAPSDTLKSLALGNSSSLSIGETVLAMGNPYGLAGSISSGIVSALGRTLTEEQTGRNYLIANIIQTTAPINPGNSGGPLLNTRGEVVGISTAVIANSQGIGFAVPINALRREVDALIQNSTYNNHSTLGISGEDMTYFLAQSMNTNTTYGELIRSVDSNGPSSGKLLVNDIIISLNGTEITNVDDLAGYLAEKTSPGDTLAIGVIRNNSSTNVDVILGRRPSITP